MVEKSQNIENNADVFENALNIYCKAFPVADVSATIWC